MAEHQYLNQGNSEVQDKQALAYQFAPSGTVGIAASGVLEGLAVAQTTTASGSVVIGAGAAVNQGSLGQGADLLVNPAPKTLDIFTANPMASLPRNDIIVFDSLTSAIIAVIGTPASVPADPTTAATSVRLARLRHAASATTIPAAKIDPLWVMTYLRGTTPDDTGWINATLSSGWTVLGETPAYRRLNGVVHLRGRGTSAGGGTSSAMFFLPVGFRPQMQIVIIDNNGTAASGLVSIAGGVGQYTAAAGGFSLAAVKPFPADA